VTDVSGLGATVKAAVWVAPNVEVIVDVSTPWGVLVMIGNVAVV
jgi:hypothetical protein